MAGERGVVLDLDRSMSPGGRTRRYQGGEIDQNVSGLPARSRGDARGGLTSDTLLGILLWNSSPYIPCCLPSICRAQPVPGARH